MLPPFKNHTKLFNLEQICNLGQITTFCLALISYRVFLGDEKRKIRIKPMQRNGLDYQASRFYHCIVSHVFSYAVLVRGEKRRTRIKRREHGLPYGPNILQS